jgi:hypothetical protein
MARKKASFIVIFLGSYWKNLTMESPGFSLQFTLPASCPWWMWREWEAEVDRFENGPAFPPNAYKFGD